MPAIPVSTPMGFVGILLLALGVFLLLSGLNIIKIEKISVQAGKPTWVFGAIFTVAGAALLLLNESGKAAPQPAVAETPTNTVDQQAAWAQAAYSKLDEARTWDLVLREPFDQNDAGWSLGESEDEDSYQVKEIRDGLFQWTIRLKTPSWYYREDAPLYSYSSIYYSIKARRLDTPAAETGPEFGLVFRKHGGTYYKFGVNDLDQKFSAKARLTDSWSDLIGWTRSDTILEGKTNELAVIADGPDMWFFINGAPVGTAHDETYPDGNVGLLVGLDNVSDQDSHFGFDDFELREKPGQ